MGQVQEVLVAGGGKVCDEKEGGRDEEEEGGDVLLLLLLLLLVVVLDTRIAGEGTRMHGRRAIMSAKLRGSGQKNGRLQTRGWMRSEGVVMRLRPGGSGFLRGLLRCPSPPTCA